MAPLRFNPQSLFRMFQPARASRPKLAKGPRRQKGLGFESLESRQMMAADMAEIVGTVRLDVQNDGNPANDTLVAGATVQLYRDNGNGTFDAGDAVVGGVATTDALGQYRFTGLGAGKYFAKLTLPSAYQTKAGGGLQEINITADESDGTIGQTIDDFESNQIAGAAPPLPSSDNSTQGRPRRHGRRARPVRRADRRHRHLLVGVAHQRRRLPAARQRQHGHRQRQGRLGRPGRQRHRRSIRPASAGSISPASTATR